MIKSIFFTLLIWITQFSSGEASEITNETTPLTSGAQFVRSRMASYVYNWESKASNTFPDKEFNQALTSIGIFYPLEKVGLYLLARRVGYLEHYQPFNAHIVARLLGRQFSDYAGYTIWSVDCVRLSCLAGGWGGLVGLVGGIMIPSIPPFFVAEYLGISISGGVMGFWASQEQNARQYQVGITPLEAENKYDPWYVRDVWTLKNVKAHGEQYEKKVIDAFHAAEFKALEANVWPTMKDAFLDINAALPMTPLTKKLPNKREINVFINPRDIQKFTFADQNSDNSFELYAYGAASIMVTKKLKSILQKRPWELSQKVFSVLKSLEDHKNFFAYTDKFKDRFYTNILG